MDIDNSTENSVSQTEATSTSVLSVGQEQTTTEQTTTEQTTTEQNELYAGKYKSVDDLIKGYKESSKSAQELNQKVRDLEKNVNVAPDEYQINIESIPELQTAGIDINDPEIKNMLPVFKELNLNNDQVNTLLTAHFKNLANIAPTIDSIKQDLGPEADTIVNRLQSFSNALPIEDQKILASLSDTPEGVDFLHRHLVGQEMGTPGIQAPAPVDPGKAYDDFLNFRNEHGLEKIGGDPALQDQYNSLMKNYLLSNSQ